jgi:hypothetical protein
MRYVVEAVDMLHEPVDVEEVMGKVEPGVEGEQVDKRLDEDLLKTELILAASPVAVEGEVSINSPQPNGSVQQKTEQGDYAHLDLHLCGGLALWTLGDGIGPLKQDCVGR